MRYEILNIELARIQGCTDWLMAEGGNGGLFEFSKKEMR